MIDGTKNQNDGRAVRNVRCLVIMAVVAAAGGCSYNPATGRTQLIVIPPQQALAMGESAMPELIDEYGGEIASAPLRSYTSGVGRALVRQVEPDYLSNPWEFTVLNSDVINAFALPGGKVFISLGLLARFENEAQVAGVLGHEIGHVTARHVDERLSQAVLVELGLSSLGSATDSELAVGVVQLFANGYQLKFGREQETEADEQGLKYMVRAGYDPLGMMQVLEVLRDASSGSRSPEFLSTHPYPETRLATVSRLLRGPYAYTQNNPQFQLQRDRFQRDAAPYLPSSALTSAVRPPAGQWCGICRERQASHTTDES